MKLKTLVLIVVGVVCAIISATAIVAVLTYKPTEAQPRQFLPGSYMCHKDKVIMTNGYYALYELDDQGKPVLCK